MRPSPRYPVDEPASLEGRRVSVNNSREVPVSESHERAVRPWFSLLLSLGLCVAAVIFVANVHRHWFLGDDCFISFRYARHLVDGWGLVWNPGERVEGYSNFLWVMIMAGSLAVGIAPEWSSNAIGVASGALLLWGLIRWWRKAPGGLLTPASLLAVSVLASSRSFTAWCTSGLETMFFTAGLTLATLSTLRAWKEHQNASLTTSVVLSVLILTRPEGLLFAGLLGGWGLCDVAFGRHRFGKTVAWALPWIATAIALFAGRYWYFGQWFPNTFYAKVPGVWWDQGLAYGAMFLEQYRFAWFLPLAVPAMFGARGEECRRISLLVGVYLTYVVSIGGDRFEFRFLVVVLPLTMVVLVEGLRTVACWLCRVQGILGSGFAILMAAGLLGTTWAGSWKDVDYAHGVATLREVKGYAERRMATGRTLRRAIDAGELPADLVLGVGGAGAVPYYTGWTTVDRRGLNDSYIAHLPLMARGKVAHERDAPYQYLVEREVAVFDVLGDLLHPRPEGSGRKPRKLEGRPLSMRALPLDDEYLVFATFVSDAELERLFPGKKIFRLRGNQVADSFGDEESRSH